MDNFGDLINLVAGGVWPRGWRRHSPDSSRAGGSSDRFDIQLGLWATHDLKYALTGKTCRE